MLHFSLLWQRHQPKIGSKRAQTRISYTNGGRKMKVNNKDKFEVKYSFLKPLSQNFEVLILRGDIINPKVGRKGPHCYCIFQC